MTIQHAVAYVAPVVFFHPRQLFVLTSLCCLFFGTTAFATVDEARLLLRSDQHEHALSVLTSLTEPKLGVPSDPATALLLGKLLTQAGDPAGFEVLKGCNKGCGLLSDRQRFWMAKASVLKSHDTRALKALERALRDPLEHRERAELELLRAEVFSSLDRHDEERQQLLAITNSKAPYDLKAEALHHLATKSKEFGNQVARTAARRLLVSFPHTPAATDQNLPISPAMLTGEEQLKMAKAFMARFRYGAARKLLKPLRRHPILGNQAYWLLGEIALYKLRDAPQEAREMFEVVFRQGKQRQEEALYGIFRSHLNEDQYKQADRVASEYQTFYPGGQFASRVAYYRAWMPYDERRCADALPLLHDYLQRHRWRRSQVFGYIAWCHVREGQWEKAIDAFESLVPFGGSVMRGKAWYWQAYALWELGRTKAAREKVAMLRKEYPLTWYDILAQQMLAKWDHRDPRASQLPWPSGGGDAHRRHPLSADMWNWPVLKGAQAKSFQRVRQLVEIGAFGLARQVYLKKRSSIEKSVPGSRRLEFIRFMGYAVEDYKHGWKHVSGGRLGALMQLPEIDAMRLLLGYPRAYDPIVERLTDGSLIPSLFVYAIMRQESRYHPSIVSSRDAVGALQMIPQTAERIAAEQGRQYDPVTFNNPRVGFPYSIYYMLKHDELWHGQLALTAASYNAGPAPVARWLRENKGAPLAFLVEEVSYNEARSYMRKVVEHTLRYLWLYESDEERRGTTLDRLFPVEVRYDAPEDLGY